MKIYVSIPYVNGETERFASEFNRARLAIEEKGHEAVRPVVPALDMAGGRESVGRSVAALLGSDAVLLMPGWNGSHRCWLERHAAKLYGKELYRDLAGIPEPAQSQQPQIQNLQK